MAKQKDAEKQEDGQKGKYNKDDTDINNIIIEDISDEGT